MIKNEEDVLNLDCKELIRECKREIKRSGISFYYYISYICFKSARLGITDREEDVLQIWLMKKIHKRK